MIVKNTKGCKPMLFSAGHDWHLDIFLEANAQVTDVRLTVYSPVFTDYVYCITYYGVIQNGNQTQIPIDVHKINYSDPSEKVLMLYNIAYVLL